MKKLVTILIGFFVTLVMVGQKQITPPDKLVFVYYEQKEKNLIVIPNVGKLHTFKIYRKFKEDIEFTFVAEKKKPHLPMRYNITPYSVTWEYPEYHSRDVEYKVLAFDKKGKELCEMQIIWDKQNIN